MSTQYLLVLHANVEKIEACSDKYICHRWYQIYLGTPIFSHWIKGELATEADVNAALEVIAE
jgi:hypothetical protein